MKQLMRSKGLVFVLLVAFLFSVTGCGYILHPERRTAPLSNQIDGTTMLFDCLWLIAGVVPGVVALVVDGVNKTWYYTEKEWDAKDESAQAEKIIINPGQVVTVRINGAAPQDTQVTLSLRNEAGREVASLVTAQARAGQVLPPISMQIPVALQGDNAKLVLALDGREQIIWNIGCALN